MPHRELLDAGQCLADRRKARDRFGVGAGHFLRRLGRFGDEVNHPHHLP
jgi:hypothetical protein